MSRLLIVLCCLALMGCDRKTPPAPPVMQAPPGIQTIHGTERIGWEQPATNAAELATIRYAVYVDRTRTALGGVSCASSPTTITLPVTFACSAQVPALTPGDHTLELASFVDDSGVPESAHSAPLHVTVVPAATQAPDDGKR
jgi:hypothetical protein